MPSKSVSVELTNMAKFLEAKVDSLLDEVAKIIAELSQEGERRMVTILEEAVTATGLERVARGGNGPGRVDTGKMVGAISSRQSVGATAIRGEWGWLDEVLDYFLYQEHGGEVFGVAFKGMNALWGSYTEMREKLVDRLQALGLEVR